MHVFIFYANCFSIWSIFLLIHHVFSPWSASVTVWLFRFVSLVLVWYKSNDGWNDTYQEDGDTFHPMMVHNTTHTYSLRYNPFKGSIGRATYHQSLCNSFQWVSLAFLHTDVGSGPCCGMYVGPCCGMYVLTTRTNWPWPPSSSLSRRPPLVWPISFVSDVSYYSVDNYRYYYRSIPPSLRLW